MQLTPEQRQSIINWAEGLSNVTAVFLLGDRAKGTAKPDSNIELGLALGGADSWRDLLTFLNNRRAWRRKLEKLLGLRIDLELMNQESLTDASYNIEFVRITLWRRG